MKRRGKFRSYKNVSYIYKKNLEYLKVFEKLGLKECFKIPICCANIKRCYVVMAHIDGMGKLLIMNLDNK